MMNSALGEKQHWTIARLAFWYLDRGRCREAESLVRGLLALDGSDGLAWCYYGEARRQQGDFAEAVRGFGEAAKLLEDDPRVWMRYGDSLLRLQRPEEARRAFECAQKHADGAALQRRIDALLRLCKG